MLHVPLNETGPPNRGPRHEYDGRCPYCRRPLNRSQRSCCADPVCRKKRKWEYEQKTGSRYQEKIKPRGRQCKDCLAWDHETSFTRGTSCDACYKQAERNKRCERCGSILRNRDHSTPDCYACNLPPYLIEILWQCTDGRMRRLWRKIRKGMVSLASKDHRVDSNPMTIKAEPSVWVPVRT